MRSRARSLVVTVMAVALATVVAPVSLSTVPEAMALQPATNAPPDVESPSIEPTEGGEADNEAEAEVDPFGPQPYETPWTWWMGVLLALAAGGIISLLGAGYYLLVLRPAAKKAAEERSTS